MNANLWMDERNDPPIQPSKQCSKCHQIKPLDAFHKHKGNRDGHRGYCKQCQLEYYHAHDMKHAVRKRRNRLEKKFGISLSEYNALLEVQGGVCAACGHEEIYFDVRTNGFYQLAVDHDHETGEVRGLLCRSCNVAYGYLREDAARIEGLLKYHQRLQVKKNGGE
jgi:hypothetical protein